VSRSMLEPGTGEGEAGASRRRAQEAQSMRGRHALLHRSGGPVTELGVGENRRPTPKAQWCRLQGVWALGASTCERARTTIMGWHGVVGGSRGDRARWTKRLRHGHSESHVHMFRVLLTRKEL